MTTVEQIDYMIQSLQVAKDEIEYAEKYMRLMSFYKTFTTKDTIASINDSIRLVSKPIYIIL